MGKKRKILITFILVILISLGLCFLGYQWIVNGVPPWIILKNFLIDIVGGCCGVLMMLFIGWIILAVIAGGN